MSDQTLQIRDPWTMPYLDTANIFIAALRRRISSKHPLYRRAVFPVALRRDPDAVIFETDDEPTLFVLVYFSWNPALFRIRRGADPVTELLSGYQAIQERIDLDSAKARGR